MSHQSQLSIHSHQAQISHPYRTAWVTHMNNAWVRVTSHKSAVQNQVRNNHPLLKQGSQEAFAGTGVYMKPYMAIQGNVHTIYSHVWFSCIMTCVTGEGQKTSSVLNRALSRIEKEFWQRQIRLVWPKLKRRMQVLMSVETEETQLGSLGDQVSSYLYYSGYTEPSTAKATQNTL